MLRREAMLQVVSSVEEACDAFVWPLGTTGSVFGN
jgi:hypothetical protein